jgi:excisionase family DNA binding protein
LTDSFLATILGCVKLISTAEAAKKLGVHITRVQALIKGGRLPAQKIGGSYVIDEGDLRLVKDRKPGRPPNADQSKRATSKSRQKK